MALVREDMHGVYVQTGGYYARPGGVRGYMHAYDMSHGDLAKGMHVKAKHMGGSPLVKLTLADGSQRYWYICGCIIDSQGNNQKPKQHPGVNG